MPVTPPTDEDLTRIAARYGRMRRPGRRRRDAATKFCGRYTIDRYHGRHHAMAGNLALTVTAAYDAALAEADVLVMPTLPAGLMIAGRHFGEATCLRSARSLEAAAGGFPFPPGN